jgi:hypothetical protein
MRIAYYTPGGGKRHYRALSLGSGADRRREPMPLRLPPAARDSGPSVEWSVRGSDRLPLLGPCRDRSLLVSRPAHLDVGARDHALAACGWSGEAQSCDDGEGGGLVVVADGPGLTPGCRKGANHGSLRGRDGMHLPASPHARAVRVEADEYRRAGARERQSRGEPPLTIAAPSEGPYERKPCDDTPIGRLTGRRLARALGDRRRCGRGTRDFALSSSASTRRC